MSAGPFVDAAGRVMWGAGAVLALGLALLVAALVGWYMGVGICRLVGAALRSREGNRARWGALEGRWLVLAEKWERVGEWERAREALREADFARVQQMGWRDRRRAEPFWSRVRVGGLDPTPPPPEEFPGSENAAACRGG